MVLRISWMHELAMSPIYFDSFDRYSDFVWKTLIVPEWYIKHNNKGTRDKGLHSFV